MILEDFGLNLLATPPQGNIFQTAAVAARDPMARFDATKAICKSKQRETDSCSLLGQDRQFDFEDDYKERIRSSKRNSWIETQKKIAMKIFQTQDPMSVAKKLQIILKTLLGINAPGQIVPRWSKYRKKIQALNPDAQ